ncbi:hypothetical protein HPB52_020825 [Rhipicephalus sanguineus]|uniref:Uncharacterized protein n=1 Tax=Rhipicephalus sanguineus TaxID=34632 RepID=A0A9D4QFK1_RHISA|nr:hypothetical protein HPB52_020825 [Rhipicephalus sanguineus]
MALVWGGNRATTFFTSTLFAISKMPLFRELLDEWVEQHHVRLAASPAREFSSFLIAVDPDEPTFGEQRFQEAANILSIYLPDLIHHSPLTQGILEVYVSSCPLSGGAKQHSSSCFRTCAIEAQRKASVSDYGEWCKQVDQVSKFLWNTLRLTLPLKRKNRQKEGELTLLRASDLPEKHRRVLQLGPKQCTETSLSAPEMLVLSRSVSDRLTKDEVRQCCS